jgi:hypothetical protein
MSTTRFQPSTLPMIPTFIETAREVPRGERVIALDAGGTNHEILQMLDIQAPSEPATPVTIQVPVPTDATASNIALFSLSTGALLGYTVGNKHQGELPLFRKLWDWLKPGDLLLADRGFGRTELARTCQFLGFHYVVRIRPDVWIEHPDFRGKLLDYAVYRGICRLLANVQYRKHKPVCQHVVVRWKVGLPEKRDEPWFLMTDLRRSPLALSELYAQRMTIEELFRDDKSRRNGYALRATQLTRAERIDRLLLILALAYILLVGLGLRARRRYRPGAWCSSNRSRECSAFTIGRIMLDRMTVRAVSAFAAAIAATVEAAPKWG